MRPELELLYRASKNPIAFIDESYETHGESTFYILGIALVNSSRLLQVRKNLTAINSGHAIHASDLYSSKKFDLLNEAIKLVAEDHDNADILLSSPLLAGDTSGEKTRQHCLEQAFLRIQREFGTTIFILDSRRLKDADESDRRTVRDLRKAARLERSTQIRHLWPGEEILLSLPDLLAWTYRQTITKNDNQWFEPLAPNVRITQL